MKIKTEVGLDRCECLMSAGAPLPFEVLEFFTSLRLPLLNLYGMSEMAPAVQQQLNAFNYKAVGAPMEMAEIKIDGEPNKN